MVSKAIHSSGKAVDVTNKEDQLLSKFEDKAKISQWAKTSIAECIQAGITSGLTTKKYEPLMKATRAYAVVMLKRMLEFVN